MGISIRGSLLCGLTVLSASGLADAADLDRVIFDAPVTQYDPGEYQAEEGAQESISGFVEGSFAYGKGESGGFSADGTRWALRGSVNAPLDPRWNIQFDASYSDTSVDPVDVNTLSGAAHAYYRVPENYAVGAFVQASRFGSNVLDLLATLGGDSYALDVIGGAEVAYFTDRVTLHGQFGFGRASYSGLEADHILTKLGARVYATDNIRFDVEGSWHRLSGYGADADIYSVQALGNYRFDGLPATIYAGYQYDYGRVAVAGTTLGDVRVNSFLTGVRFNFGSGTLKDDERKGPMWSSSALHL